MKTYKEELKEFLDIYNYIDEMEHDLLEDICYDDRDAAYQALYDKAFSRDINRRMQEIFPFDWYDPDAGYDDDYKAWKCAVDEIAKRIKRILNKSEN